MRGLEKKVVKRGKRQVKERRKDPNSRLGTFNVVNTEPTPQVTKGGS